MPRLIHISPRNCTQLRWIGWSLLIILFLVFLPFLFHFLNRGIDWITDLLPHPHMSWEESLWCL